eukprot:3500630-Rhodomonas_salina.1
MEYPRRSVVNCAEKASGTPDLLWRPPPGRDIASAASHREPGGPCRADTGSGCTRVALPPAPAANLLVTPRHGAPTVWPGPRASGTPLPLPSPHRSHARPRRASCTSMMPRTLLAARHCAGTCPARGPPLLLLRARPPNPPSG